MKIGDHAIVIDDNFEGKIVKINKNTVFIEDEHGFELAFSPNELVVVEDATTLSDISVPIAHVLKDKGIENPKKSPSITTKHKQNPSMVVDLHLHKLIAKENGLTAHQKLNIQIDTAKHKLEFAIQKRFQTIVFIHGVGEGVLKAEIETLLRRYDQVKFYDADYKTYGLGATEVYIYQNY